jgi:hypothetical protein
MRRHLSTLDLTSPPFWESFVTRRLTWSSYSCSKPCYLVSPGLHSPCHKLEHNNDLHPLPVCPWTTRAVGCGHACPKLALVIVVRRQGKDDRQKSPRNPCEFVYVICKFPVEDELGAAAHQANLLALDVVAEDPTRLFDWNCGWLSFGKICPSPIIKSHDRYSVGASLPNPKKGEYRIAYANVEPAAEMSGALTRNPRH